MLSTKITQLYSFHGISVISQFDSELLPRVPQHARTVHISDDNVFLKRLLPNHLTIWETIYAYVSSEINGSYVEHSVTFILLVLSHENLTTVRSVSFTWG